MNKEKYLFSKSELEALVLTALATYVETLHFDLDVAAQTAELIAKLDEDFGKGLAWKRMFSACNREIAEFTVNAVLRSKKYIDKMGEENNG